MSFPQAIEDKLAMLPERQDAAVRGLLPSSEELPSAAPYERVLLAILQLGGDDVDRVGHFVAAAKRDWRDVLYWSEHPPDSSEPSSWEELRRRLGRKDL